jgi:hypothetical protein
MNCIIVIIIASVILFLCFNNSSGFRSEIGYDPPKEFYKVYNNEDEPKSCDFKTETRPYPSGNLPGSYLGLSPAETNTLLMKFIDYKNGDGLFKYDDKFQELQEFNAN